MSSIFAGGPADQNCRVLCKPAKWTDVAVFYIGNYLARAATVRSRPGQTSLFSFSIMLLVLLYPTTGLVPGIEDTCRLAVLGKTPLQEAARAGALFMVKEYEETGEPSFQEERKGGGPDISNTAASTSSARESYLEGNISLVTDGHESNDPENAVDVLSNQDIGAPLTPRLSGGSTPLKGSTEIHGRVRLPSGWILTEVPRDATFKDDASQTFSDILKAKESDNVKLAQDYSFVRAMIALGQTLYAISTLYNTRGFQVQQLGYAAFGFTVIPYAFMSFINLLASLICPVYPKAFVVENEDLRRLRHRIALEHKESSFYVEGVVGKIQTVPRENVTKKMGLTIRVMIAYLIALFLLAATYLSLVGALSNFRKQDSTLVQRVWTMAWFSSSTLVVGTVGIEQLYPAKSEIGKWLSLQISRLIGLFTFAGLTFAIGGFVVVGQMILQVGICETI